MTGWHEAQSGPSGTRRLRSPYSSLPARRCIHARRGWKTSAITPAAATGATNRPGP